MSQWRIAVRALYSLPSRPATTAQVEIAGGRAETEIKQGLVRARELGLVQSERRGVCVLWWMTPQGIQWCQGGTVESHPDRRTGGRGRRMQFGASWAAPLAAFGPSAGGLMCGPTAGALTAKEAV